MPAPLLRLQASAYTRARGFAFSLLGPRNRKRLRKQLRVHIFLCGGSKSQEPRRVIGAFTVATAGVEEDQLTDEVTVAVEPC
jgi:hypothetical protein